MVERTVGGSEHRRTSTARSKDVVHIFFAIFVEGRGPVEGRGAGARSSKDVAPSNDVEQEQELGEKNVRVRGRLRRESFVLSTSN